MSIVNTAALRRRKLALFASALAAPGLLVGVARAETAAETPTAAAVATSAAVTTAVPEIVVTSEKRSERLQAVPLAVTAIGTQELQQRGILGNEDLARSVPSLAFTELSPGQNSLSIRGLTNAYGLSPTVSEYIDEVPLDFRQDAKSGTPSIDLSDAARVEVLRGPQGTLYGSSSLGGTIRIILNQPDPSHFSMHGEAGMSVVDHGGGGGYAVKMTVNAPVTDKLAFRMTATHQFTPGFTDQVLPANYYFVSPADVITKKKANSSDNSSVRVAAAWKPDDTLTIMPSVYFSYIKNYGYNYSDQNRPQYQYVRGFLDKNTDKLLVTNLEIKKNFGFAELTSSSSYTYMDQDSYEDYSSWAARHYVALVKTTANLPFFPATNYEPIPYYEYTQEVRLASTGDGPVSWILGAYYSSLKEKERQAITSAAYGAFYSARFGLANSTNILDYHAPTLDEQYAGFGSITVKPISMIALTAGARAYDLRQTSSISQTGLNAGGNVAVHSGKETGINPRFNLDITPTDDLSFYATAAKGFRPGGPNTQLIPGLGVTCTLTSLFDTSYQPDSVWNYEGGAKTQFFDRKLTFNTSVYQIDWSNIQGSLSSNCGTFIANFGTERIKGAESEVTWRALPQLTLTASASYNDARYTDLKPGVAAATGFHLNERGVNVPRLKYTLGGEYNFMVGNYDSYLRADLQHIGSTPTSLTFQTPSYYKAAYTNVDASVGAYFGAFEVQLYVKNLTNEYEVLNIANSQTQTYQENVVAPPRTVGFTVRYAMR